MTIPAGGNEGLFARLPIALYRSTKEGRLLVANSALARLLGYESVDELMTASVAVDFYYTDPPVRATWLETIVRDGVVRDFDIELRRKDGSTIWVEDTAQAVFDDNGELLHIDGALIDVTDKIKAQKAQAEFIATVSHELRNPMTVLLGLAKELHADYDGFAEGERREIAGVMARQAEDAAWIIEDLLVAYRDDVTRLAVVREAFDVREELERVLEVTDKPVTVEDTGADTHVYADPRRTRQILRNLISNAVKYGGERIKAKIESSDDAVRVWVQDDGEPLGPEEADRIFLAFQRGNGHLADTKSVGLGLSVARTLAGLMAGSLEYRHDGEYSSFILTLPAPS